MSAFAFSTRAVSVAGMTLIATIVASKPMMTMTTISRSEEHTSELQSLMRISYAVFCLKKQKENKTTSTNNVQQVNADIKDKITNHQTATHKDRSQNTNEITSLR